MALPTGTTEVDRRFGVTQPISKKEATQNDLALSQRLVEHVERFFPCETNDGMAHRASVLEELQGIIDGWASEGGSGGSIRLRTLGSYRLGVVHPGSDIDTLCIGSPGISREAFFTTLVEKLAVHSSVKECVPIPDAYTPIIKLKVRGVSIDLLYARLLVNLSEVDQPDEVVTKDECLKNMDERCVRCLNGFRVADLILNLVPNQDTFRQTLRVVKYWARQRGIYSNVLGFFGGITWSLLVARVCQLFPNYAPNQLLSTFFVVYSGWDWPKPVILCDIVDRQGEPGMYKFKVWNKNNPQDRAHLMPVITPAFPSMNSTHNVTETTKRILIEEFKRGLEIVKRIDASNTAADAETHWSKLHEPLPFFTKYKCFLSFEMLAKTEEVGSKFSGWIESKLRILVMNLESLDKDQGGQGMFVRPNPTQYENMGDDEEWPYSCTMCIALDFSSRDGAEPKQRIDLRHPIASFLHVVKSWDSCTKFAGKFRLKVKRVKPADLPEHIKNGILNMQRGGSSSSSASSGEEEGGEADEAVASKRRQEDDGEDAAAAKRRRS
eukprot:TRINITY_DN27517_c0_g1_i1.p1 TRINITY_DN27517_c0_g1~~TRINITY_DN27517_c0_g1_i1.p1  ORF type:complete len:551 (+),score=63.44 TRINITY_DN27517_c0_g1_i1:63-1715(+)